MGNNRELMEEVNQQFIRRQLQNGVERLELFGESIDDVLQHRPGSFTALELEFLADEAPKYGYIRSGDAWVLAGY